MESTTSHTDADGRLRFRAGSPAIHVISRSFIQNLTNGSLALAPHKALKKISYVAEDGTIVKPASPNGIKLEFFIFDALPFARNPMIVECSRAEQFAAIKNPEGNDSPESCREALVNRAASWLEAAGVKVPRKEDGTVDAVIEISPRRAVCAADVKELAEKGVLPAEIKPGERYALD